MLFQSFGIKIKNLLKTKVSVFTVKRKAAGKDSLIKEGLIKYYYKNKKLKAECNYKNGVLNGISIHYYNTGIIKAKENYKNGKLHGLCKYYSEDGTLREEKQYKDGFLVSTQEI